MSYRYELTAIIRADQGKGASRRLRKQGFVPAIVYGGNEEPLAIAIKQDQLAKNAKHESFFSQIINLKVEGKADQEVIVRAVQHHIYKPLFQHFDFQRIVKGQELHSTVAIHFENEENAAGVKLHNGIVNKMLTSLEIICEPRNLPEAIVVDLTNLDAGNAIHLADLKLPEGVRLAGEPESWAETVVVSIVHGKGGDAEEAQQAE